MCVSYQAEFHGDTKSGISIHMYLKKRKTNKRKRLTGFKKENLKSIPQNQKNKKNFI